MERKLAEALVEIATQTGIEARLYENYSGRGMCGEVTTGVVLDDAIHDLPSLLYNGAPLIAEMMAEGHLDAELPSPFRSDNLGHDTIVY